MAFTYLKYPNEIAFNVGITTGYQKKKEKICTYNADYSVEIETNRSLAIKLIRFIFEAFIDMHNLS